MAVLHNLFPPVFPQKVPYLTNGDEYDLYNGTRWYIYFDIGDLNKIEDIKTANGIDEQNDQSGLVGHYCQISLIDSRTNSPVLIYNNGTIKLAVPILNRVFRSSGGENNYDAKYPYYISLDHQEYSCIFGQLDENVEYKLQMRFLSKDITMPSEENVTGTDNIYSESGYMEWLDYSNSYASEWSKVAIIKRIRNRRLRIMSNKPNGYDNNDNEYQHDPFFWFYGILDFENPNSQSLDYDGKSTQLRFYAQPKYILMRGSSENSYTEWQPYYYSSFCVKKGRYDPLNYDDAYAERHSEMRENIDSYNILIYRYNDWYQSQSQPVLLVPIFDSGQVKPSENNQNLIDYLVPKSFLCGLGLQNDYHCIISITTTSGKILTKEKDIIYTPRIQTSHLVKTVQDDNLRQLDLYQGTDMIKYNNRDYIDINQWENQEYLYRDPNSDTSETWLELTAIQQLFDYQPIAFEDYPLEGAKYLKVETPQPGLDPYTLDLSLKNGIWYEYLFLALDPIDDNYYIQKFSPLTSPTMFDFEDIILIDKEYNPLKIKLNPNISSYKYNLNQIQQTTLGNQFPFIRRNGKQFYRTFSISGLISSYMDDELGTSINGTDSMFHDGDIGIIHDSMQREGGEDTLPTLDLRFGSKEDLFQKEWQQYQRYEQSRADITNRINFLYERKFRERVIDFLYNKHAKLLKSPTEGNIIVRLQDVNFTPNQPLSRGVYEFSATAIEVDKANLQNCDKIEAIKIVAQEDEG